MWLGNVCNKLRNYWSLSGIIFNSRRVNAVLPSIRNSHLIRVNVINVQFLVRCFDVLLKVGRKFIPGSEICCFHYSLVSSYRVLFPHIRNQLWT